MLASDMRDILRDMGEQNEPIKEALRRMIYEFADEHYHTCPDYDAEGSGCDCFAGHLVQSAFATLSKG